MKRPIQVPERYARLIMRIMVGGFIVIGVCFISFMLTIWYKGNKAKVRDLEVYGAVKSLYQSDKRDTKWWVARITDGKSTVLEDAMLGRLQVGDSLFKKKGDPYFTMVKARTGERTRIRIIQP